MNNNNKTVRIFMMPIQYPCGPQSACCGPIGQSEEEIKALKEKIERELGVKVEVRNVLKGQEMKDYRQISGLFRSFGPMSLPIIALEDEVVAMGNPTSEEIIGILHEKIKELENKGGDRNANL